METFLFEDMTFDQLFRYSEPKRVKRSTTVRGPPLEIQGNSDTVYHVFNFKSFPSTTGLRHHGYVRFKKPAQGNPRKPLQHIPCEVDCTCPDFRYRWAWADKQRGASRVGKQSMNQAHNRAPRITNPDNIPGLCKHILAARDYIYGMLAKFPGGEPDTGEKLAQLVKYADKRWANFDTLMAKAKDQEKWFTAVKAAVNQGQGGNLDVIYDIYQAQGGKFIGIPKGVPARGAIKPGEEPPEGEEPPPLPPRQRPPRAPRPGPELPAAGRPTLRAPTPPTPAATAAAALPIPPGQRGRGLQPPPPAPTKNNLPIGRKTGKPTGTATPPGKRGQVKRPGREESLANSDSTRVSRLNGSSDGANNTESMSKLNEAIKLIEEIESDDGIETPSEIAGEMAAVDAPPPSEPPVSDDAIGADTEGNVVLQLLADIKDLLSQLVGAESGEGEFGPEGELGPEGEGEPSMPPGGGDNIPVDALPEPDEDEEEDEDEDAMPPRHAPEGQD